MAKLPAEQEERPQYHSYQVCRVRPRPKFSVDLFIWGAFLTKKCPASCEANFFDVFETANKRKSRSEFRCGFLFEEPGGFKGGSPVSSSVVVVSGKTRVLCQEPSRAGRRRRGLRVGAQRPHRHPGPTPSPTVTSWWRRKTTNTWWAPWHEVEGLNGAPIGLNGPSIGFKS